MKFIKFLTRKYTLLEHRLIVQSMWKENTLIPGIYYTQSIDVSQNGVVDVYTSQEDAERNKQWVIKCAQKDPRFVERMLKRGLEATKKLARLPLNLPNRISKLTDEQIIKELFKLRKKFFDYGAYLDFTHYLGDAGIKLTQKSIVRLSKFHDDRKKVFMSYFAFLKDVCREIAKKRKVKSGDISHLSFSEIIRFLKKELTPKEIDRLQRKRKKRYIAKKVGNKDVVIVDSFKKELAKFKKKVLERKITDEIRGAPVNKGIVRGVVKVIGQATSLSEIPSGRVIVTQMTAPDVTPVLKMAKAIITDEGGILCHAAHVAREFGLIAIIGTKIATRVLKDGDLVEVDANKGVVKIIKRKK